MIIRCVIVTKPASTRYLSYQAKILYIRNDKFRAGYVFSGHSLMVILKPQASLTYGAN